MLIEEPVIDEISPVITNMIEKVIKIADKHDLERNDLLEKTAVIFYEMMQVASYEDYVCKKPEVCTRIECIRSMSVKEMADKILALEISTTLDFCQNFSGCQELMEKGEEIPDEMYKKCLVKWLNSVEQQKTIPTEHFKEGFSRVI